MTDYPASRLSAGGNPLASGITAQIGKPAGAIGEAVSPSDHVQAGLTARANISEELSAPHFRYEVECFDSEGNLKWREDITNLVTTVGKNDLLDKYFKGSAYTAAWYLGLKGPGTAVVGDTLASHAGWSEVNPYSGNRPAIAFGTTSAGSNTATTNTYTITGTATVAGAFVANANSGTSGILYSAGDFSVARGVGAGDTLNATLTVTAS